MASFLDNGIEPVVVVSGVVHSAYCAIGFHQAVRPLHEVAISGFPLVLLVSCVGIVYGVVKSIARVCLSEKGVGFSL